MLHITLPGLLPITMTRLILRLGQLMSVGFEKIILLYNPSTYETADVISTYVYRHGILDANYSYAAPGRPVQLRHCAGAAGRRQCAEPPLVRQQHLVRKDMSNAIHSIDTAAAMPALPLLRRLKPRNGWAGAAFDAVNVALLLGAVLRHLLSVLLRGDRLAQRSAGADVLSRPDAAAAWLLAGSFSPRMGQPDGAQRLLHTM